MKHNDTSVSFFRDLELRRRRKEATEGKVNEVKRKMREAEDWQEKKRYFKEKFAPFCVGLAIFSVGLSVYYYKSFN